MPKVVEPVELLVHDGVKDVDAVGFLQHLGSFDVVLYDMVRIDSLNGSQAFPEEGLKAFVVCVPQCPRLTTI